MGEEGQMPVVYVRFRIDGCLRCERLRLVTLALDATRPPNPKEPPKADGEITKLRKMAGLE